MEGFEVFYFRTHFMIELLLGCVVFSVPLARRRGFWLRAIPGAAVCLILCFVFPRASVTLILRVLVAAGWAWLCFAVSLRLCVPAYLLHCPGGGHVFAECSAQ